MNLVKSFEHTAGTSSAGIVFLHGGDQQERVSYYELREISLKLLGSLQARGVHPGDEIIIQTDNNLHFILIFWACLMGKIIPVPLSIGTQAEQKLKLFRVWKFLSNPYWASGEQQYIRVTGLEEIPGEDLPDPPVAGRYLNIENLLAGVEKGIVEEINSDDLAYIQFSSGSTGEPKGVCLTHDNLLTNIHDIISSLGITSGDTLFNWMPLTHDMGIIGFHLAGIVIGIEAISMPTPLFIRRPLLWMEAVARHRATVLYSPNFGLQYFLSALQRNPAFQADLSCIRIIVNGAEPIAARLCEEFSTTLSKWGMRRNTILAAYGLAEASVEVAAMPPGTPVINYSLSRHHLNIGNKVVFTEEGDPRSVSFVDVGFPVSACAVRICSQEGIQLPDSTIGHLQIKGRNVTAGYYHNAVATQALFTEDGWLRTGDLGFITNGRLVVTGRYKNLVIINGQNFYPHDIEESIITAGLAEQGKVVACSDNGKHSGREELIIFVLHKEETSRFVTTAAAIKDRVLQAIGIAVDAVVPVPRIPKTTSGKIQHYLLLEQYTQSRNAEVTEHHASQPVEQDNINWNDALAIETYLQKAIGTLLGTSSLAAETNLADAGMNSLMAMQLSEELSRMSGKAVPIEAIFSSDDIKVLSRYISTAAVSKPLPPVQKETATGRAISSAQQRLFAEYLIGSSSAAYHIPVMLRISGPLNIEQMWKSVRSLVERYDSLRTAYGHDGQGFYSKVYPYDHTIFTTENIDLRKEKDLSKVYAQLVDEYIHTPFILEEAKVGRAVALQTGADELVLLFVFHHISTDGWSLQLFFKALLQQYTTLHVQPEITTPVPAPLQYQSYSAWQQGLLRSGYLEPGRKYWLSELNGFPSPVDFGNTQSQGFHTGAVPVSHIRSVLSNQAAEALRHLSVKHKVSVFSVLLTTLNTLLYRYTNQKDIIIGFDSAGRISGELAKIHGYMLNTLCLRSQPEGKQPFAQLLLQVHHKILTALEHQLYPFEEILREIQADQQVTGNPLFSIMVLFQNFLDKEQLQIEGCELTVEQPAVQHGFTDLVLEFIETNDKYTFHIQYNTARYPAEKIRAFTAHFNNLLAAAAADDTLPIGSYNFISDAERAFINSAATNPFTAHRQPLQVHRFFEKRALLDPEAIAVWSGNEFLTYRELNERCNCIAHRLKAAINIKANDRIAFRVRRNENIVVAMLAIMKTGAAFVALDDEWPVTRCVEVARDAAIHGILADSETIDILREHLPGKKLFNIDEPAYWSGKTTNPIYDGAINDLAYLIYTSGSTGKPRGVMVEHGSLTGYVQYFTHYFGVTELDVVLQQASVAFDTIIEEVFPALCAGAQVVIAPRGGRDIGAMITLIKYHRVSILSTTPLVLNELNYQSDSRISTLRLIISGGDVLHPHHIDQLFPNAALFNTYGPSEATVCATYHHITALDNAHLIGKPVGNREVYILDGNLRPMPPGFVGELYIGGGLARGYLNDEELTAKKFIEHPFAPDRKLYRSGDFAKLTDSGDIEFAGRADEQVKIRGHRVELEEVEQQMMHYPGITQAAVTVHPLSGQLVGFAVSHKSFAEKELRHFLHDRLPYYMVPHHVERIEQLPRTANAKLNRKQLQKMAAMSGREKEEQVIELQPQQAALLRIVQTVLRQPGLTAADHFFDHGCNSIKAAAICAAVQQQMQCSVTIRDIFLYPTVLLLSGQLATITSDVEPVTVIKPMPDYPLSSAQNRLWLLSQLQQASYAYHESEWYELNGALDINLVQESFGVIVDKYEVFRTSFRQREGLPVQVIHAPGEQPLSFIFEDLSATASPIEKAQQVLEDQFRTPFNLAAAPLYRIVLVKIAAEKYWFTLVMHHLLTDDWSARIIIADFMQYYGALQKGHIPAVSAPPVQYKDYAAAALKQKEDGQLKDSRAYWLEQLAGNLPVLDIYPDYARPAIKSYEGKVQHTTLDSASLGRMNRFCREQQLSLFMFLASGVFTLLHKYSGQDDIIIGTPVADRAAGAWQEVPGFFIHTLPLRLHLTANDRVADLFGKVKTGCLNAMVHQSYPLEYLLSDLKVKRDLSRSPLFDVIINLSDRDDNSKPFIPGIEYHKLPRNIAGSKYDLEFYFETDSNGLHCAVVYDSQLFSNARISRLLTHLTNLLHGFICNSNTPLRHLSCLDEAEKQMLLYGLNATAMPVPHCTVTDLFLQQLEQHPAVTAVHCAGASFTYDTVDRYASRLAASLLNDCNIKPGDRVALLLSRSEQVIFTILGIWKAGAAYVPVDPGLPPGKIEMILEKAAVQLVITDLPATRPAPFHVLPVTKDWWNEHTPPASLPVQQPAGIAYVIFTSGSTGEPKGVEVPHTAVVNLLLSIKKQLGVQENARMLSVSAYTFDISVSEFFLPLITGGMVHIATAEEVVNARLLKNVLEQSAPNLMQGTPGLWNMLIDAGWAGSPGLTAITCGEPLGNEQRDRLLERTAILWNLYGPTETTIFSSGTAITSRGSLITIGKPIANTVLFILDQYQQPVPVGTYGQLYIGGHGVARGYLNQPALTAQKFVELPALYRGRLYATGDVVRYQPDGTVEYIGRMDNQVKIRGFRVELGEIDHAALQCPQVQAVATLLQQDKQGDKKIIVFVVYKDGMQAEEELRNTLRAKLPAYMLPARYTAVSKIPLTINGKVDKAALLAQLTEGELPQHNAVAPVTRIEKMLVQLWEELLGTKGIGITDDFFDLGGHSLMANQLVNKVYHHFSISLLLSDIFSNTTIRQLGQRIEALEREQYDVIDL